MTPLIVLDLAGLDQLWPGAGLFRYAVDLLFALQELAPPARFMVFGATPEPIEALRPLFGVRGRSWDYMHLPRAQGIASHYRDHLRLAGNLTRVNADLCHCLHMFVPMLSPCPIVVTMQDMMYELFPEYALAVKSRLYRLLRWCTRRRARRVICPSQTTADDLSRLWGISPKRIDVVPHGLMVFKPDAAFAEFPSNLALKELGPEPIITSPLNLEPRKNLITLLEAFAMVRRRFPTARLLLYGKGGWSPDRELKYRSDLNRLCLNGAVIEPGVLADADLGWAYRKSRLFVFPTLYEGFGYPALEAMAAGTCTVVRGCSSMAEVVAQAGVQVEPMVPTTLANAIGEVLDDDARRRRLGEAAKTRAGLFTSDCMARGTFASYVRCIQAKVAK